MQKHIHLLSVLVAALIGVLFVALQPFPMLHDFPEWMYQGWLVKELWVANNATVAEQFRLLNYPVPNSISQLGIAALNRVVTPVVAGKIWLSLYLALSASLWWLVIRARDSKDCGAISLLLMLTITLGPGFWNGYINFQFGLLFFAFYLYLTVIRDSNFGLSVMMFSMLVFFSHAAVYAAFVVFVFLRFVGTSHRWRFALELLPSLLLLLWYMKFKLAVGHISLATPLSWSKWLQYKAYTLAKQGPFHNFIMPDGESLLAELNLVYMAGFIVNFAIVILIAVWFVALIRQVLVGGQILGFSLQKHERLTLVATPILLLVLFLMAGQNTFGVVNLGERFLAVALMMGLMFFRLPVVLRQLWTIACVFGVSILIAGSIVVTRGGDLEYSVDRSADQPDLEKFVDNIYANSRHKYFNHRLFIYADRGQELVKSNPILLPIDLPTSIVVPHR